MIAVVVLVAITTPLNGSGAGPGTVDPRATSYLIAVAAAGGPARSARPPRSSRSRSATARPTSWPTSTATRSAWPTCGARPSGSTSGRPGARPASRRSRSCASLSERYHDRGLELIAISVQETSPADVQAYADRYQLGYTIGFDGSGTIFHEYKAYGLPTQVFIDPERRHPVDRRRAARRSGRDRPDRGDPASRYRGSERACGPVIARWTVVAGVSPESGGSVCDKSLFRRALVSATASVGEARVRSTLSAGFERARIVHPDSSAA